MHLREAEGIEDAARVAGLWVGDAVTLEDRVLRRTDPVNSGCREDQFGIAGIPSMGSIVCAAVHMTGYAQT